MPWLYSQKHRASVRLRRVSRKLPPKLVAKKKAHRKRVALLPFLFQFSKQPMQNHHVLRGLRRAKKLSPNQLQVMKAQIATRAKRARIAVAVVAEDAVAVVVAQLVRAVKRIPKRVQVKMQEKRAGKVALIAAVVAVALQVKV